MTAFDDNFDKAAELQEALNEKGLAEVRKSLAAETHPDFDGRHCIDCADEIPDERLAMQKIRCVHCQDRKERGFGRR